MGDNPLVYLGRKSKSAAAWLWKKGIVSTFMAGFFVVLPFVITMAIMGWVGSLLVSWLGPGSLVGRGLESLVGRVLESLGLQLFRGKGETVSAVIATVIGWATVLIGIWLVGLFVKSATRQRFARLFTALIDRIPVVNSIYRTVAQVVGMLKKDDGGDMRAMSVVYCAFGEAHGGGFLALLPSTQKFAFAGRECLTVYIPASPLPMSGGIVFVPVDKVYRLDMTVDDLMQVYFSLGVMTSKVVPEKYLAGAKPLPTGPVLPRPNPNSSPQRHGVEQKLD